MGCEPHAERALARLVQFGGERIHHVDTVMRLRRLGEMAWPYMVICKRQNFDCAGAQSICCKTHKVGPRQKSKVTVESKFRDLSRSVMQEIAEAVKDDGVTIYFDREHNVRVMANDEIYVV